MGLLKGLLLCSVLVPLRASASETYGPLSSEVSMMESRGYSVSQQASASTRQTQFQALVFSNPDRGDNLKIYRVEKGRARLVFLEPRLGVKVALASIHEGGDIPDLIGDGSRILAYTVTLPGLNDESLVILRYANRRLKPVRNPLPFGRFERIGEGKLKIVSRDRPLGQFFALRCESFRTMAMSAFRTTIYAWHGSTLVPVSTRYPDYFESRISGLEQELKSKDPRADGHYGDYLGSALSLYFDYAEIGRGREGWRRFVSFFPAEEASGRVKSCLLEMEATLRRRLNIPNDW